MSDRMQKILFVDDEQSVLSGIERQLHDEYEVVTASSGPAGLKIIEERGPFAVVVSDMRMPEMDGAQFLASVRMKSPETERVLLTGHADIDAAIAAVNDGQIFRYLVKPCGREVLVEALEAGIERYKSHLADREMAMENQELKTIAMHDALLDMPNKRAFENDMEDIHSEALKNQQAYALALIQLDSFAEYTEFYGAQGGDIVLQAIANYLGITIQPQDLLYRYDNDTFVLVLTDADYAGAHDSVSLIVKEISARNSDSDRGYAGEVTVNGGVAALDLSETEQDWRSILEQAQEALGYAELSG